MEDLKTVSDLLFPEERELQKTASQRFDDEIRAKVLALRKQRLLSARDAEEEVINPVFEEIGAFIREHVRAVGKEQAVRDFQCGLNFLHKDLKEALKEDGELPSFSEIYDFVKNGLTIKQKVV